MRFAPLLFGTIVTGALLWLVVQASNVFLLLFLAVLLSLFLRAVADVFESRLRLPPPIALLVSVLISISGLVGLVTLLVPPFAEQTRALDRNCRSTSQGSRPRSRSSASASRPSKRISRPVITKR